MPITMNTGTMRNCKLFFMNTGTLQDCKKVWMNRDGGVADVFGRHVLTDMGVSMRTVSFTAGSGTHNPLSGGSSGNWTILFNFVWWGSKGGALLYHNYNQRESIIRLYDDGRIGVWAARYDTGADKSWYSTKLCKKGCFNQVLVNKTGQIYINGENATPSGYGGDMPMWGEFKIFPDRDIEGICMGIQGWNWNLGTEYVGVTATTWPFETDPSTWTMKFDGNLVYDRNGLSGAQKNVTGTATYETWFWGTDRKAIKVS